MESSNLDKFRGHKKRAVSTLNSDDPRSPISQKQIFFDRRCGNSTRLCDYAIQLLFEGKLVVVEDHNENVKNHRTNYYLFQMIMDRIAYMKTRMLDHGEHLQVTVHGTLAIEFSAIPDNR